MRGLFAVHEGASRLVRYTVEAILSALRYGSTRDTHNLNMTMQRVAKRLSCCFIEPVVPSSNLAAASWDVSITAEWCKMIYMLPMFLNTNRIVQSYKLD